nr:hypothetical protein L204_05313 [Cryptococcus depauperatus CBS 7855]
MSMGPARRGKPRIRPPRKVGPETSIQDTWAKLSMAITEIQNHNVSKLSFEEHYRYAYNMVLFKQGDQLYSGVRQLIAQHLDHLAETLIVPTFPRLAAAAVPGSGSNADAMERSMEGDRFLKSIKSVWDDHTGSIRKLRDVLKYMDKVYTTAAGVPQVYELGLTLFLVHIIRSAVYPIHAHLISTLLSQIQLERDGETITRSTLRECVDVLLRLKAHGERDSVYAVDFEPVFLQRSADFYEYEASNLLAQGNAPAYLSNIHKRLKEEADRTIHYLSLSTSPALQSLLIQSLLTPHLDTILHMPNTGLVKMVDRDGYADLKRLYELFLKVPEEQGKKALRQDLRRVIEERGNNINAGAPNDDTGEGKGEENDGSKQSIKQTPASIALSAALRWVQDTLDLKDKFDKILDGAFSGDKQMQGSINEAFQSFINANPRAAEFLSLFIDDNLKKGSKTKTDAESDTARTKTLTLFRFLTDKDKFERYYKTHLARRLLYQRSSSEDGEREMVGMLKREMGFQFTHNLEGMFTDMKVSEESTNVFRNDPKSNTLSFDMTVSILTASSWPSAIVQPSPINFPSQLSSGINQFQQFYDSRHSGRRLTWQGALGTGDIRIRVGGRIYEVNVSTQGIVVLSQFEGDEKHAFKQLRGVTGLKEGDLTRTLMALCHPKHRLLIRHADSSNSKQITPDDKFSFNENFKSNLVKIKVVQIGNKVENKKEREETMGEVEEERKHQIEACIVRTMKDRKILGHNALISEVAHQLSKRFVAEVGSIKKRVEGLIDREYIERTEDRTSYRYLA